MLRNLRARRRPRYGAHLCALIAALLLLLSVSILHSRLGSDRGGDSRNRHYHLISADDVVLDPLLGDADPDDARSLNNKSDDRIDELDEVVQVSNAEEILGGGVDSEEEEEVGGADQSYKVSNYYFDHINGVIRRGFDKRSIDQWEDYESFDANLVGIEDQSKVAIGSDDVAVDEGVRRKVVEVKGIEDLLLLKTGGRVSKLREGWGPWFDAKSDFLRRDRMFKSNLEVLNPLNNRLLQDPDGVGVTGLTRGDKLVQKGLLNEFKKVPFLAKKPLGIEDSDLKSEVLEKDVKATEVDSVQQGRSQMKRVERRTLDENASKISFNSGIGDGSEALSETANNLPLRSHRSKGIEQRTVESRIGKVFDSSTSDSVRSGGLKKVEANGGIRSELSGQVYANGKRWGYFPGLHPGLSFLNFMDGFFRKGKCSMRVFMVWNSPPWMFSVRQQRGLESLLFQHRNACVVVFSETVELNFFEGFVKDGYGGLYLDSDILVLRPLSSLNNTVGLEDLQAGSSLNGAVMSFGKHSPFIMECLTEFYSTYDDNRLQWNGAGLLTRAARNFLRNKNASDNRVELELQPSFIFFPVSRNNIIRYFSAPATESERTQQDELFQKMADKSFTFHFWNSLTSALVPEPESLVSKLLNRHCIRCSDVL
ncbi:uncharacterized protein At4g19900 isoform X2 [Rhododendron vialii]|uniref:uncharacterized protein At4g19900 isoform X2 n=1 Tax=Rhododendron vialii TaxID=182163 RepID=UPI00265EEA49|nr:uncharacterized protein At4g19900 isoform X2 [Rhododendron vialii]